MHDIASKKLTKSAKITGHVVGSYHPHGPEAAYGALVTLYKQGFVDVQGNFGSPGLEDARPSAMRYTEAKLKKWVEDFCFKYIDLVPWDEYEYEREPLFLPSPIPIGLIGDGDIYSGLSFHRTVIPRYNMKDLAKRLKYLITEEASDKIIIYPNMLRDGCSIKKDDPEAEKILKEGFGTLTAVPACTIKNKELRIMGRVPQNSFNSLREDASLSCKCYSGETIDIAVKPVKKVDDFQEFCKYVLKKHLIKNINFIIYVCDDEGKVQLKGVDELLLTCYEYYVEIVKVSHINNCIREIEKKYTNEIILIIREILTVNPKVKTIDEIVKIFGNLKHKIKTETYDQDQDKFIPIDLAPSEKDVRDICNTKSIRSLIEHKINIQDNDIKIVDIKTQISNNVNDCYNLICEMCK
jgi:hypothetical protein